MSTWSPGFPAWLEVKGNSYWLSPLQAAAVDALFVRDPTLAALAETCEDEKVYLVDPLGIREILPGAHLPLIRAAISTPELTADREGYRVALGEGGVFPEAPPPVVEEKE